MLASVEAGGEKFPMAGVGVPAESSRWTVCSQTRLEQPAIVCPTAEFVTA